MVEFFRQQGSDDGRNAVLGRHKIRPSKARMTVRFHALLEPDFESKKAYWERVYAAAYNRTVRRTNPRKVNGKSTTLRNMASVTITKLPNGVVKIIGRKMRGKR
jgi:hypothetical protein